MEQPRVRLARDGDIAVIVIDNPPIHAGSAEVREGLMAAIVTLTSDAGSKGTVLIGGGTPLMGGSDLQSDLDELAASSGPGFIRGDVRQLFEAKA